LWLGLLLLLLLLLLLDGSISPSPSAQLLLERLDPSLVFLQHSFHPRYCVLTAHYHQSPVASRLNFIATLILAKA
jgi:hypothetical protein